MVCKLYHKGDPGLLSMSWVNNRVFVGVFLEGFWLVLAIWWGSQSIIVYGIQMYMKTCARIFNCLSLRMWLTVSCQNKVFHFFIFRHIQLAKTRHKQLYSLTILTCFFIFDPNKLHYLLFICSILKICQNKSIKELVQHVLEVNWNVLFM